MPRPMRRRSISERANQAREDRAYLYPLGFSSNGFYRMGEREGLVCTRAGLLHRHNDRMFH
jgi:hypothetical protein